jgi:hypothetical protein
MLLRLIIGYAIALTALPAMAQDNEGGHSEQAVSAVPSDMHRASEEQAAGPLAEIRDGYGNGGFTIVTANPGAQVFFNNGMELAFAFVHQEAIDAMSEAAQRDPTCAMCASGHAYTLGPTLNFGKSSEEGSFFGQLLMSSGYFAMARFEDPVAVLELQEPHLPYLRAAWHYARGEAYALLGDADGIAVERNAIPERVELCEEEGENCLAAADQMLIITRAVLAGRLAMMEARYVDAAEHFEEAALTEETEDFSRFSDPPAFWYPVRRDYARALVAAGDEEGALREARATLEVRPRDPIAEAIIADLTS